MYYSDEYIEADGCAIVLPGHLYFWSSTTHWNSGVCVWHDWE